MNPPLADGYKILPYRVVLNHVFPYIKMERIYKSLGIFQTRQIKEIVVFVDKLVVVHNNHPYVV